MAFKWDRIQSYADSETALYRLIGEMMQRKATLDDLERVREFLLRQGPGAESWRSIGEALYHTTSGSPAGFDIWVEWTRALPNYELDEQQQGETWASFADELSEAERAVDDGQREVVPPALAQETSSSTEGVDDESDVKTDVMDSAAFAPRGQTGVLGASATQLLRLVPAGPYAIRVFGETFDDIDEYTVLTLMKRGLFLGCEVRFGDRWIPSADHPAFHILVDRLRHEAFRILSNARQFGDGDDATNPR